MKFPVFAAENDLLARVQSSFVQSDSFRLLRGSPCAFLDALFLRFIVRFIVFPNHTRRPRYNMKFKGQGDPQAPATPATASPPYAAPMSAPSESN